MSEEYEETMRRGVDAVNRMDVEAIVEMTDPQVEWRTELIGTPVYRGHEGVRQALRDVDRAWESWHTEATEVLAGDQTAFLGTHATARAKATGIPVEADLFYVAFFRGGKIVRFEGFNNRSQALEAAGLSE
jgi:ketosteroid isomerase-like protein